MTGQCYVLGAPNPSGSDAGACISLGSNGASVYEYATGYMPALAVYSGPISISCPLVVKYDGKTPSIYLCGNLVASGLTSTKTNVYAPTMVGLADYGAYTGDVAEIILYNRALDDTDRGIVENYLQTKYTCLPTPTPTPTPTIPPITPSPTSTPTPTPLTPLNLPLLLLRHRRDSHTYAVTVADSATAATTPPPSSTPRAYPGHLFQWRGGHWPDDKGFHRRADKPQLCN